LGFFLLLLHFDEVSRSSLELGFVELAPLELSLSHEPLGSDHLGIIVRTLPSILEVHESLEGDEPCPFFIAISGAEVEHILQRSDLKSRGKHILLFAEIALIGLDFPEIDELRKFLEVAVCEDEDIVHGEHHPTFPPLLQKLRTFVDGALTNLVILKLTLNYLRIH
jgi:hypothetical protein